MKILLMFVVACIAAAQGLHNGNEARVGTTNHCAPSGGTDTYACTITGLTVLSDGGRYSFKADVANTGAASINFTALGAKTIVKMAGGVATPLSDNDIRAGQVVELMYDGTNMQMVSQLGNAPAGGGGVTIGGLAVPATWWNQGGCPDFSLGAGGGLYWECTTTASTAIFGKGDAVTGSWAHAVALSGTCDGSDCHLGLYARNTSGGSFWETGLSNFSSKAFYLRGLSGTGTTVSAGTPERSAPSSLLYVCLTYDGTTLSARFSENGTNWKTHGSSAIAGLDQVGFAIRTGNAAATTFSLFVWRRGIATSTTCPTIPVLGPL